jgi:hypothetical protein
MRTAVSENTYLLVGDGRLSSNSSGTYLYSLANRSTGKLQITDSLTGASTFFLGFSDLSQGAYAITQPATGGFQIGSFVLLDTTPPTISISSPTNGAILATATTTVSGIAGDPGSAASGLNRVEVRVNGGAWQTAVGTANWSRSVTLTPCGNTLEARSLDQAGNYSSNASASVTYLPLNTAPHTPTNISPSNATANVSVTPALQASAFSDADCVGDTHAASQWQVLNSAGAVVVADSGLELVNKVSWIVPAAKLYYGSNYQWRVRYRDSRSGWSSYSAPTLFTTVGPWLSGSILGTSIVLKWPTNAPGFLLQWVTNVGAAHWSNASPAPVVVSGQYTVTLSASNSAGFYRLKK